MFKTCIRYKIWYIFNIKRNILINIVSKIKEHIEFLFLYSCLILIVLKNTGKKRILDFNFQFLPTDRQLNALPTELIIWYLDSIEIQHN